MSSYIITSLCSAAFVADIYGVAQAQGPVLTAMQSSQLDMMYLTDPELLLARVGAAVNEVLLQCTVHSFLQPAARSSCLN